MLRVIRPCLPSTAERPPSGDGWLHEIKHDGMRIMARRDSAGVRLITRQGNDFTARFPLVVEAVAALPGRSFLLDGEAIVTNDRGLAVFDLIRRKGHGRDAVLCAFDLIEFDGEDLRRRPIEPYRSGRSPHWVKVKNPIGRRRTGAGKLANKRRNQQAYSVGAETILVLCLPPQIHNRRSAAKRGFVPRLHAPRRDVINFIIQKNTCGAYHS